MTDEREEIARIIDHEGFWERLDRCNHALATVAMTDDQRRDLTAVRDDELRGTTDSLAKADAILARDEGRRGVEGGPVAWVSPKQLASHQDGDYETGLYLPVRKTPAGMFTQALYAAAPSPPVADKVGEAALSPDVIRLVIAVRNIAYDGQIPNLNTDEFRELDRAVEAFAARVPWENEPSPPIAAAPAPVVTFEALKRSIADGFSNGNEQYDQASQPQRDRYDMAARSALSLFTAPGDEKS